MNKLTVRNELLRRAQPKRTEAFWKVVAELDYYIKRLKLSEGHKTQIIMCIVNLVRYAELIQFHNGRDLEKSKKNIIL